MFDMIKVVARKPLDIRHPKFDDTKPASKENPMSLHVPDGHVFEIPDDGGIDTLIAAGYVDRWKPEAATVEP
jgi:hypothetical protein